MGVFEDIKRLSVQLMPTGRAFKTPIGSYRERLEAVMSETEFEFYQEAYSLLYTILPDNSNFTTDDAAMWEVRLGLPISTASIADRKAAIVRKLNHPGTVKARQNHRYVQAQLQLAGFNVYIHENIIDNYPTGWDYETPDEWIGGTWPRYTVQLNDEQLNDFQLGGNLSDFVANKDTQVQDATFVIAAPMFNIFFIGGQTSGTTANVSSEREKEFRQLILKLKPVQTVAMLAINYV